MEALEDSTCPSLSDGFSLYERYMRSFNVLDTFLDRNKKGENDQLDQLSSSSSEPSINAARSHHVGMKSGGASPVFTSINEPVDFACERINLDAHEDKPLSPLDGTSLNESSSVTEESGLTEKSDPADVPVSSEDSNVSKHPKPVIITSASAMENSNNAVDSVPLFNGVRPPQTVFKLPISELSFNGTIKHVQNLQPIVDPISALSSANNSLNDNSLIVNVDEATNMPSMSLFSEISKEIMFGGSRIETSHETGGSTGDSVYNETVRNLQEAVSVDRSADQSYSSLEASFDSGVRSPDMFSEDDEVEPIEVVEPETNFWDFLKDFEAYDKKKARKMEETLQGVLPPPSVTILKIDVSDMLKKYHTFLPAFTDEAPLNISEENSRTPTKRNSFIRLPDGDLPELIQETDTLDVSRSDLKSNNSFKVESKSCTVNTSVSSDKSVVLDICTESEAKETAWPDLMKCRYYGIHYNLTKNSEKLEALAQKCGERFIGNETECSVSVFSGALQSPSSASKRKALRLKMAQAKSPGRRLSHLARRRQAFCSAATISEKAHSSNAKMVLIDKNYFPHRKLINMSDKPRRRTPGKKTPGRKTPGKKTPAKTPKTRSGGSSRKKAMRRLTLDPELRTNTTRETKRALFTSPDASMLPQTASSVPAQAMKSKRALFGSPETKSESSDVILKRKRSLLDDSIEESKSKVAKSLSFGGDSIGSQPNQVMNRRASEMFTSKSMANLDETHRKKLLWAVSEALRIHGWRMQSPGFREKATALARLTRRLLTLPYHAARMAAPKISTSESFLKIARQYVFAIIQGKTVEECFIEEQTRLANETNQKVTGYVSASMYQQMKAKSTTYALSSKIKENTCDGVKQEQQRSGSKNILQDKLINIDSNSSSTSVGVSTLDKAALYKSNSMPTTQEAAKMRARRQISFDNVDFPKR